ncbi:MAG: hypothetical protein GY861_12555 [bacterium]|nr:hypothetical protein [bacterium]
MKDIVIHCPGEVHKEPRYHKLKEEKVIIPKILLIVSDDTVGRIKIQCNDSLCKKTGSNIGWYEVNIKGLNNYSVEPVPKQVFDLKQVPIVVMGDG